jgi:hypothetical protein
MSWFAGVVIQTTLVATGRTHVHRRLGWVLAALAVAVFVISTFATFDLVPRYRALGADMERLMAAGTATVVWSDLADLLGFAVFVSIGIALRRQLETHKRLMILATISIVHPAMVRVFALIGVKNPLAIFAGFGGVLVLIAAVCLYDITSRRRLHLATLLGGSLYILSKVVAMFVVATSAVGRSFVRGLG